MLIALAFWIQGPRRSTATHEIAARDLPESWVCAVLVVRDPDFYLHRGNGYLNRPPEAPHSWFKRLAAWRHVWPPRSKDDQLRLFFNRTYLGTFDGHDVYGFPDAARVLYKKDLRALSGDEFLSLVAMMPAPNELDPTRHRDLNDARIVSILEAMEKQCDCSSSPRSGYGAPCR